MLWTEYPAVKTDDMQYEIKQAHNNRGILVFGSITVEDLNALVILWGERGYDTFASGISSALGATFALCNKSEVKAWEDEITSSLKSQSSEDNEFAWLNGTDTGTSSKTIFRILSKEHGSKVPNSTFFNPDIPHDPADFGRCYRLLKLFPAWRNRLVEVSSVYPAWTPLVTAWDKLEALYEDESPSGSCPRLYSKMLEITCNKQ